MKSAAAAIGCFVLIAFAIQPAAQTQEREIRQLPAGNPASRLSPDLEVVAATGADFVGVTRGGGIVVRPRDGVLALENAFKIRGLALDLPAEPPRAVNELIVSLANADAPLTDLPDDAAVVQRVPSGPFAVVRAANGITPALVQALAARAAVTRVEPNYPFFLHDAIQSNVPDDADYPNQWALERLHAEQGWSVVTTTNVTVAVLDTGIDVTHPDLLANLWINPTDTGKNEDGNNCRGDRHGCDFVSIPPQPLTADPNGHGTHCAGTIGAVGHNGKWIAGVAWRIPILGVRVVKQDLTADAAQVARGINYAVAAKARIISASFGSYLAATEVTNAVARAVKAGALIVASAGNTETAVERNNDRKPMYPASLPDVIAVMASDRSDAVPPQSRFGEESVHIAAPGVAILSLEKGGGIGSRTGTSMAVPFVAGVAALHWGQRQHATDTAAQVTDAILRGARQVPGMKGRNKTEAILDMRFLAPQLTTKNPITKPPVPPPAKSPAPQAPPKAVQIGAPSTWTGRLGSILAVGGETSGLILQLDGRRVELAGSDAVLSQLANLIGQMVSVRGRLERVTSVERGEREQVRVTELIKK